MTDLTAIKRVLYFASQPRQMEEVLALVGELRGVQVHAATDPPRFDYRRLSVRLFGETEVGRALERLQNEYFNLVVIDFRGVGPGTSPALEFARALVGEEEVEARYALNRVVAIVNGGSESTDNLIAELGGMGLRHICRATRDGQRFARRVVDTFIDTMLERRPRLRALCASGGGITGLYYELGVLKCLDDCTAPEGANTFDLFYGISAGAVVTSLLAVGYSVDEIMAAIAGHSGGRLPRFRMSVLRPTHLNLGDQLGRLGRFALGAAAGAGRLLAGRTRPALGSLFFDYSDLVGPFFRTDGFGRHLQRLLEMPGATNDFRELPRPLYIGATDQDSRRHVLFGSQGYDNIPISQAIQASMSLNPAFRSTQVGGRYYEDGAVTRTSNFGEAIRKGADLVIVLDPLVPYVSPVPGYARRRGLLYNVDQDIRSMSYSRFEQARLAALREHPEVSLYTFLPGNELRRQLSNNPLDHRGYLAIWRGAYLSTLHRIMLLQHRLRGDLEAHGIALRLGRALGVAERLRGLAEPRFEDFFPDGIVSLRRPPLARYAGQPHRMHSGDHPTLDFSSASRAS